MAAAAANHEDIGASGDMEAPIQPSHLTIFVTGGGGYVASHCIVDLLNEGFKVIAVDNYVNCIKGKKGITNKYVLPFQIYL